VSPSCAYTYGVATISRLLKFIGLLLAKEPYKRDDILQKRPMILRSLLIVATLYIYRAVHSADQIPNMDKHGPSWGVNVTGNKSDGFAVVTAMNKEDNGGNCGSGMIYT